MNLNEFELQSRDVIEQTLNHLQTATLLITELEAKVAEVGQSVQALSQLVEIFVTEQRNQQTSDDSST